MLSSPKRTRFLLFVLYVLLLSGIFFGLVEGITVFADNNSRSRQVAEPTMTERPSAPTERLANLLLPSLTAVKTDTLLTDNDGDGTADPGDLLRYTIVFTNSGPDSATGVVFTDTIDAHTTLSGTAHISPIAFDDSYDALGNVGLTVPAGSGLLANDVDPDANSGTLTIASFDATSANGRAVSVNTADGSFTYLPAAGYEGADTFTYTLSDGDPLTPDGQGTVTITVNEVIWFVDNTAAGGGDGRLGTPYNSLAAFVSGAADESGDIIFLYSGSGNYSGGLTLLNNQFLIGQGATASIAVATGITVPPHSNALPGTGGTAPTITYGSGDGVILAASNTLHGFNVGAASGFGVSGNNVGVLTVSEVSVNNSSGGGVSLNGSGTMNVVFDALSASGGTNGISLTNVGGTFTANGGSVSGSSGTAVNINGGNATITYAGSVSKTSAGSLVAVSALSGGSATLSGNLTCNTSCTGVSVLNNTGGAITFSGGSKVLNTGGNTAVNLTNNSGTTINFTNGGLDIDTASGTGFSAIGGGTINVTGTGNTIDTGASTGFNINDTIISTSGVTFQSISVNGGGSSTSAGIILDDTGTGTFTVTGVGTTAGSGGTIQDILEDGIRLFNTDGTVSISNMIIEDIGDTTIASPGHHGVDGQQVDGGLTLNNVTIQRVTDSAIHGEALGGGSTVWNGLTLTNSTLAFSNRFHIASVADGGGTDEAMVTIEGISGSVTITGNDFDDGPGFVNLFTAASGNVDITVQSNTFDDGRKDLPNQASVGSSGVRVNTTGTIDAIIQIGDPAETDPALGNVFTDTGSDAAIIVSGFTASDNADIDLIISQNSITVNDHTSPPGLCEPADGINNCAFDFPNGGIGVESRGSGTFEAIISQNTLVETQNSGGLSTGSLRVDVSGNDTEVIVRNNTLTRSWDGPLFIRADDADGNGARGFLLIQDNVYQSGPIGALGSGDDLDAHGLANSPSPFLPNRFQVRNGAILDLTVINDNMVSHDTGTNPQFDSLDIRINGDAVGGTSSILNVLIQNTEAPEGFRLRNDDSGVDATDSEINLSRGLSTDPAATDINATQAESVLDDNGNTTGGGGASADVPFSGLNIVTTVPTLPSIAIATLATNEYYVKQDAHNSPQLFKLNPLVDEVQEAPYNTGASVAVGSFGMLANYLLPENRELQSDAPTLYDELSGHQMLFSGETMTVNIGDLPAGKSVTVVFDVTVDNTIAANDAEVCNQATIQSNELPDVLTDDPDIGGASDPTCTAVEQADLSLTKSDSPDPVLLGETLVYTVTITNNGPSAAQSVILTDTLPAGVTLVSTSGCTEDPAGVPTCSLGTLSASSSAEVVITTTVNLTSSGTLSNSATVGSTTHDPDSGNNTVSTETTILETDFGDAPDPTYPTLLASNGARHYMTGPFLGTAVDGESDGQPTATATGDNDDGVTFTTALVRGNTAAVEVVASAACTLSGWVDFNADGDWRDAGEDVFPGGMALTAGNNTLNFPVPAGATLGTTFTRFRCTTEGAVPVTGLASDGEVEDYQVEIVDNAFSMGDVTLAEGDSGNTQFTFTITRTENSLPAAVDYATSNGTAVAGEDYTAVPTTTVNFTAGGAFTHTVVVAVSGDTRFEEDETFTVTLSNPLNGGIGDGQGMGTIVNDDAPPAITVAAVTDVEAAGTFPFTVTLSAVSGLEASVSYSTTNDTAVSGSDYIATSGVLTIPAGSTSGVIEVTVLDDGLIEGTETFTLTLSNPIRATVGDGTAVGTILDDESLLAFNDLYVTNEDTPLAVSAPGVLANDSGGAGITAVLDTSPLYGTLGFNADGSFVYTPTLHFNGSDSFTYHLTDGVDESNVATVTLTVTPVNDPPLAVPDSAVTAQGTAVTVDVLANDTDVDAGDLLSVAAVSQPAHGVVVINPDQTLTYTPTQNFVGDDVFSYEVSDGVVTDTAAVTIRVLSEVSDNIVYLPLVLREYAATPDLVVREIHVFADGEIEVVIANVGDAPVQQEFWVDLYIDPEPVPTAVNQIWPDFSAAGLVWGVRDVSTLSPGGTLILSSLEAEEQWSNYAGSVNSGTVVAVQVDSANAGSAFGAVLEGHEMWALPYNNIRTVTVP